MRRTKSPLLLIIIFIGVILVSCLKDDFKKIKDPVWEPTVALPLIDSKVDVERVLEKVNEAGYIAYSVDNVVTIVYSGKLFTIEASELVSLEDVAIDLTKGTGEVPFPFQGKLIKHIELDSGRLNVQIRHSFPGPIVVDLRVPSLKQEDVEFFRQIDVPQLPGGTTYNTFYDISDHTLDLTGSSGTGNNIIQAEYEARDLSSNLPVPLDELRLSFQDMVFNFIDGHMGKINLGLRQDSMILGIFQKFKSGTILFDSPEVQFIFKNSFGIPITATLKTFTGNGTNGTTKLTGSIVNDPLDINGSEDPETGNPKTTIEYVNNDNSNISNFIAITPRAIGFGFDLSANQNVGTEEYNFLFNKSRLEGILNLHIPLKGSLDSVIIEDDFEFETTEMRRAKFASFKLWTENMFPLGIYFQVYFVNKSGNLIDSLVVENEAIFKEAETNSEGFSILPSIEEKVIAVDAVRFERIRLEATKMRIRAMLLSDQSDQHSVNISRDDFFHFKLGLITQLNNPLED